MTLQNIKETKMSKICKGTKFGLSVFMAAIIIGFISIKRMCIKNKNEN